MALSIAWPVSGEKRTDWERMVQFYGFCEVLPDRSKPNQVEKAFKDWAMKRRLAYVEGQNMVAFDPKAFNPKDSLDRAKFAFLARYFRPRETVVFQRDLETAFNIRSMYVLDAIQSYWMTEGVVHDAGGRVQADRDLLRLMGFTYIELMQALDGVVKKQYLDAIPNGHRLADPVFGVEFGQYIVNFDILKERFFDGEFVLQAAGQPIPFGEISRQTGIENIEDLRNILREAKKRYDLNIEVSDDHVMFGPPSKSAVESLIARERQHKERLTETEGQLKERSKTIRDLLDRYTVREAKIMNEIESLKEEGRMVYVKSKVVDAVQGRLGGGK
jgi:hypothetical protein